MFEQAELRGIPMGPTGSPNAKGTAQIAPKIAILENQANWVVLIILGKTGHLGHFGHPFSRQDGPPEKKFHLESDLNQRDEAKFAVCCMQTPTEARTQPTAEGMNWQAPASTGKKTAGHRGVAGGGFLPRCFGLYTGP